MTAMSRFSRALGALAATVLAAGCAGPLEPSPNPESLGSPAASIASPFASLPPPSEPSAIPSPATTPIPTRTPPPDPTYAPDPTPEGALPPRTEVEVVTDIRDRPGVPADLFYTYWWTEDGDAGQVGTTAQVGLPSDETILTVAHDLVVSARLKRTGLRCQEEGCTLIVRDIRTGETVRQIETNLIGPAAMIVPGRIYWAGMDADRSDFNANVMFDGGVWTSELDKNAPHVSIVPPGQDVSSFNYAGRLAFDISPSGMTITSGVGGFADRFIDVIDVQTLSRRTRLPNIADYAVTDDLVITGEDPPSDYPSGGILAIDIDTREVRWRYPDRPDVDRFEMSTIVAAGDRFLLQYLWRGRADDELRVGALRASTGAPTTLFTQTLERDRQPIWAILSVSTERHLLFGADLASLGHHVQYGDASIAMLDLRTGILRENAFTIDVPWMCFGSYCLRNEN